MAPPTTGAGRPLRTAKPLPGGAARPQGVASGVWVAPPLILVAFLPIITRG